MSTKPNSGRSNTADATATLSDRQRREVEFYQHYAAIQRVDAIDFTPVDGHESRPWNPYWYVYELVRSRYVGPSQRLLDFGCGVGIAAVRFAHLGYQVEGFDISPDNIREAGQLAQRYGLDQRCRFGVMPAEKLDYPDNHFDVIAGIDILHHIEIDRAIAEAHRVLKPGGVAIFKEHVEVVGFDTLRNSTLVRRLVPTEASLDNHITEDERKLNAHDMGLIARRFDRVEHVRFTLLSRLDRLIPRCNDSLRAKLQRIDHHLLRTCPPLGHFGGTAVLICHK